MIIVTGGSKGIGRSIVLALLERGHTTLAIARGADALTDLAVAAEPLPGQLYTLSADLSRADGCGRVKAFVEENSAETPLTLINNAGQYSDKGIMNEADIFEQLLSLNLLAAHRLTRLFDDKLERIINIGSVAALDFPGQMSAYAASKAALHGWHHAMVEELKKRDIKLALVIPGATLTNSWANESFIPEGILRPEQIADVVISIMKSSKSAEIVEIRPSFQQ